MGATFLTMIMDGKLTASQVKAEYDRISRLCEVKSGSRYSGTWNMCPGIIFPKKSENPLPEKEAYNWLSDNCQKREAARAIKCVIRRENTEEVKWMVGGACAD